MCCHFVHIFLLDTSSMPAKFHYALWAKVKKIPSHQVIEGTNLLMVVLNVCASESPIRNVAHITLLASKDTDVGPGIVKKKCAPPT